MLQAYCLDILIVIIPESFVQVHFGVSIQKTAEFGLELISARI